MIEPTAKAVTQGPGPLSVPEGGERTSIVADLRVIASDLVEFRELLVELTIRDIRIRYKQAVMGVFWAILTPLVLLLSGWILRVAFGRLSGQAPMTWRWRGWPSSRSVGPSSLAPSVSGRRASPRTWRS